jgi:hypoxanthine-DNA glycosylase
MESIFQVTLPDNEAKIAFCLSHKIGLWDVIGSCERKNSSDNNLKGIVPNDFEKLLKIHPNIVAIGFTGKKAYDLFNRYFKNLPVKMVLLPSTSPAHASMTREEKTVYYNDFIQKFLAV